MSTYSTNLALELIGTGEQAGVWGTTTNTNLGTLIEQAISGYVTQAVATGTDTTITIPNGATGVARNMYIELTGTGGTNTNLIVPANKKLYFIFNNSTGAVTVKVSGQTGVSVPQGKKVVLTSNGTDIVNGLNYIADFGSNSATITQLTATSATITNLTLTSLVISNLSIASANITTLTSASATITNLINTSASITTLTNNPTFSAGTANGVLYLNGSKVATSGSAVTYNGTTFATTGAANFATSSGNVGVGMASPASKLNIYSDTSSTYDNSGGLRVTNASYTANTVAGVLFETADTLNSYMWGVRQPSYAGQLAFGVNVGTNGTSLQEGMRLTSTGLGIGTASPAYKLDVNGNAQVGNATASTNRFLYINGVANKAGAVAFQESGTNRWLVGNGAASENGNFEIYDATNGNNFILTRTGNLGLGVTPSAWGSGFKAIEGAYGQAFAYDLNVPTTRVVANAFNDGSWKYKISSFGAGRYDCASGAHQWFTAPSGTAGNAISFTQAMTLNSSGNLGIGTSSPTSALVISGDYLNNKSDIQIVNTNGGRTWRIGDGIGAITSSLVFWDGTAGAARMVLNSSGNVGIGTSSPGSKLSLGTGTTSTTDTACSFRLYDVGGANGNNYGFGFNTSDGRFAYTAGLTGYHAFFTANTERMRLDSSGNLGLGVTPSAWGAFGVRAFQVGDTVSVYRDSSANAVVGYNFYLNSALNPIYSNNGLASQYRQGSGSHIWFTAPSGTAGNAISFTQAMTLDASGNLGIGTTSPVTKLNVASAAGSPTGVSVGGIRVYETTNNYGLNIGGDGTYGYIQGVRGATTSIGYNDLVLQPNSGNLGIGTTSPSVKLEVNGQIRTAAPTGGTAANWRLGTVHTVSPTSPNRTIEVDIGGTIYYLHAKTTNN